MQGGSPLLIRRDAQRALSLAIAWFLAFPTLTVIAASVLWPAGWLFPNTELARVVPPLVVAGMAAVTMSGVAALALYWSTYRRPRRAWTVVCAIGVGLVVSALVADLAVRAWELVLVTFVWPMAPALMALDAAWRSRRSPGSS